MPPSKLPSQWQSFFVGRRVRHPDLPGVSGVVKYAHCTRVGEQDAERIAALGVSIRTAFAVDWDDGSREVMEDSEVAKVATDEFVKEEWVMEKILALQAVSPAVKLRPPRRPARPVPLTSPLPWPSCLPAAAVQLGRGQGRRRHRRGPKFL
jgi:hypothetical protein